MRDRIKVVGGSAIVKIISGKAGEGDAGLILRGATQCLNLAEALVEAAEEILRNEKAAGGVIHKSRF